MNPTDPFCFRKSFSERSLQPARLPAIIHPGGVGQPFVGVPPFSAVAVGHGFLDGDELVFEPSGGIHGLRAQQADLTHPFGISGAVEQDQIGLLIPGWHPIRSGKKPTCERKG